MRAADLFQKYRISINPPYARKDFLTIGVTIFVLLAVPLTVLLGIQGRGLSPKAKETPSSIQTGFVNLTYEYDVVKNKLTLLRKKFNDLPAPPSSSSNAVKLKAKVISRDKKEILNKDFESTTASTDKLIFEIQVPNEAGADLQIENNQRQVLEQSSL